jgi:hypothetical protein
MEIVTIKIRKDVLQDLHNEGLLKSDYEVKTVDVTNFDYTGDTIWLKLKSESTKAYKALKKREFELRHN